MNLDWKSEIWLRILLLAIIVLLLGVSPVPKSVTASLDAVKGAQKAHDPVAVADNLVTVVQQQPWRKGYWEAAGHAALSSGEPKYAGEYFSKAASLGELTLDGYLAWGDADWQIGYPNTALQIWVLAERFGVSPAETLPRQAEVYRFIGDDLALIEVLKDFLALQPGNRSQQETANLYLELGTLLAAYDPASAPAYLLQAMEIDPTLESRSRALRFAIQQELSKDDPVYLLMIAGRTLANQGDWMLAEKAFENATNLNPAYAEAWAYLGEARQHTSSDQDPFFSLQNSLEIDPQSFAANTFMALYWQRQEAFDQAFTYTQKALALDPDNPAVMVQMGNLSALLGDLEKGENYYRKAMASRPNDAQFVREFIKFSLQYNLDLRATVLPTARQLVISNPEDPGSLDVMGEVLFRLGDLHNAERFFKRALDIDSMYDQAHLHLADMYRLQGESDLAKHHYHRVLLFSINAMTVQRVNETLESYFVP